jgi:hypothetical protein
VRSLGEVEVRAEEGASELVGQRAIAARESSDDGVACDQSTGQGGSGGRRTPRASRWVRGCERVWGTGFADRGWGLVQERHRVVLFTLAARITSHADTLVMKIGRCANDLADLLASRLRIAQLSTG